MAEYLVNLNNFQGPLDLLLHLIREKNLDIFTIDVGDIATQYMDYLMKIKTLNLDIASEYLVMAAYLLELKSHRLLKQNSLDETELDDETDNREELIQKLLEYQKIKDQTTFFQGQEEQRQKLLTRIPVVTNSQQHKNLIKNVKWDFNLEQLNLQLQEVYQRYQLNAPITNRIARQEISPQQRAIEIITFLQDKPNQSFLLEEIFQQNSWVINNNWIVVTFSAILDLVRNQQIHIKQETMCGPITLKYRGETNETIE